MQFWHNKRMINSKNRMFILRVVLSLYLITALSGLSCTQNSQDHQRRVLPAEKGLMSDNQFQISPDDSCPVCGMTVSNYPKFAGAIQLDDGSIFYTCGTGCLVRCWLDPEGLLGVKKSDMVNLFVQEFFSGNITNVDNIIFVTGSDFIGPMGRDVAPVDPSLVDTFISRHGGSGLFKIKELTIEIWQDIQAAKRKP